MHGEQEINEPLVDQQKVEEQSSADIAALQAEFQRQQQQQQQQQDTFIPLRGDEVPAFAVDDAEIFQIKSRWTSVGVADVYDVKIVNVQHFDDEAEVKQSGLFVGKKKIGRNGMLKSADLSFSFRLPYRVNKDELSVSVTDAPFEVLSSFVTEVQFGIINENSQEGHFVESASVDEDSIQTATVTIPLVRDLSQSIPVFDQINYHGQHVLHKTIEIKGFDLKKQKAITYYIRTKIIEAEGKAEITSVTTSYIDAVRVAENWASFKLACTNAAVWTRNLFSGCKCGRKKSTTDSDTALEAGASPSGSAPVPQLTYVSSSPTASMAFQPPVAVAVAGDAKVVAPSAPGAAPQLMTPMRIHGSDQVVLVPISAAQAAHLSPSSFVVMNKSS